MDQKANKFDLTLSAKQIEAFDTIEQCSCDELTFGGAKGGSKTVFGCKYTFFKILQLIKLFDLKPSQFPPVMAFIGRKQSVDFTTSTLNTWKRDIPPEFYSLKEQKKLIVIDNTAAIQYGGMDDSDTIKKFNSAEYAFVWLDQAEECSEQDVGMLRGTLRLTLNGIIPAFKALWTCNPVITDDPKFIWLKRDFIDNPKKGFRFIRSLYTDNPFLPKNYGEQLDKAYGFNPSLLAAYKEGKWDQLTAANIIIPRSIVTQNVKREQVNEIVKRKVTVADIAEEGEDETVIYDLENTRIVNQEIYSHKDLMDTVGRIIAHAKHNGSSVISVDKIGLGAGVFSRLKEVYANDNEMIVNGFDSRITAPAGIDFETYWNYKAFAWFNAAKIYFNELKCNIPDDPVLINQLSSQTFKFTSNGKMVLENKDVTKVKLGQSPDRADAYIMGLDALRYARIKVEKESDGYGWVGNSYIPQPVYA